jgi:starch-binding outer membrane protein, SusD/RagB family
MKTLKTIIAGLLIAIPAITLFTGCKKFLDRKPLTATVNDLQGGELEGKVLGLYGEIRNSKAEPYSGDGLQNIPWVAMNGFRSDDAEVVADPGASAWHQTYDNFQYTKDDWGAGMYWNKHYVFIGLCNDALEVASKQTNPDVTTQLLAAEARFFRAYAYFELVRTYGDVPKIDFKINSPTQGHVAKSAASIIYALIDADLTYAEAHLPLNWAGTGFFGRLTSGAAKSLHAKTLLYRQQWTPALDLCKQVIASAQYSLVTPYWQIFKKEGELGPESIWEIQADKKAGDGDTYWSRLGQCQGVRGSGTWDLGWGWNTPTASLVASYEAGDVRKDATILFSGQSDGGFGTGGYGLTVPPLTNALYWNKKVYNRYEDYLAAGLGTPNNEAQNTWINYRVLRFSDVLLMAAEAANEIGGATNQNDAVTWTNMIRTRATLPNISFTTQAAMRTAIKKERRAEFAMEYERFFDLVRWGDAVTVLGPLGYQNKHRFFPIPQGALNDNPALVQNPEW